MIMRLHFHQDLRGLISLGIEAGFRIRRKATAVAAGHDCGVIVIRGEHTVGTLIRRVSDHRKQRRCLLHAVDRPVGVEDFMATMLGIGLSKHHQFDITRVPLEFAKAFDEIVDFIRREGESEVSVGTTDCIDALGQDVDGCIRRRLCAVE